MPVSLLPELEAARNGDWIITPYFVRRVTSNADNLRLNHLFLSIKSKIENAIASSDWSRYVALHLPQHREEAFLRLSDFGELPSPDHNQLVGKIWTDTEIIQSGSCFLLAAMRSDPPHRTVDLMTPKELKQFRQLPPFVTAYRSHQDWNQCGPCWTLLESVAIDFAANYGWNEITCARVPANRIVAYFDRRGEDEIVLRQFSSSDVEILSQRSVEQ